MSTATVTHLTPRPASVASRTDGSLALVGEFEQALSEFPDGPVALDAIACDRAAHLDGERCAHRILQAAIEIAGGNRPATQLLRWTTSEVYADLSRRGMLVARAAGAHTGELTEGPIRPRLISLRSRIARRGAIESAAHVRYGARSRAVAARFELRRGHWICVALEFA